MLDRIINAALERAGIAPEEFDRAVRAQKFKTRLEWLFSEEGAGVLAAYNARVRELNDEMAA